MSENKRRGKKIKGRKYKIFPVTFNTRVHLGNNNCATDTRVMHYEHYCIFDLIWCKGVQHSLESTSGNPKETLAAHRNPKKPGEVLRLFLSLPTTLKQKLPKGNEIWFISSACMFQNFARIFPFSSSIQESSI